MAKAAPALAPPNSMIERTAPKAPYKAHKGGICATGSVCEVRNHPEGGGNVRVTVRHGEPKKPGEYDSFNGAETPFHMPAHLAKRFPFGQKVTVAVMPHRAKTAPAGSAAGGDEATEGDEAEDAEDADEPSPAVSKISTAFRSSKK